MTESLVLGKVPLWQVGLLRVETPLHLIYRGQQPTDAYPHVTPSNSPPFAERARPWTGARVPHKTRHASAACWH